MKNNPMRFFNKETIVYFIALIVTLVWSVVSLFIVGKALKLVGADADMTAVLSIYATITAVFMNIQNFYFGSTKGSQERNAQMVEMAKAIPTASITPTVESDTLKSLRQTAKDGGIAGWDTLSEDQLKTLLSKQ